MSAFLDNTNLSRITSASWNTGNGVLTLTRNDSTTVTVDLDNRYQLAGSYSTTSHNHSLDGLSNTTITSNTAGEILKWNGSAWVNNTLAEAGIQPAGNYLTSYTETDTLATVTARGATTSTAVTFSGGITGNLSGNAATASTLQTARTIALSGDVSGSASFNGGSNVTITATVADDSHNHVISNVDGLQSALNGIDSKIGLIDAAFDTFAGFHSGIQTVTSAQSAANVSGPTNFTFAELANSVQASVYINRFLLRPTEYSISGTTVTIATGVLATDDEIEVLGTKVVPPAL